MTQKGLLCKSLGWFLHDRDLRNERVHVCIKGRIQSKFHTSWPVWVPKKRSPKNKMLDYWNSPVCFHHYNSKCGNTISSFDSSFDQTTKCIGAKLFRHTNAINFNGISFILFRLGRNSWSGQNSEETPQRSTKLMQLNYLHLKILKLKSYPSSLSFWSHFFVPMLLDDKILLP